MTKNCSCGRMLSTARELFIRKSPERETGKEPDTRERIMRAARSVFAERGASATVRDICSAAGANVAAVSYHFGNKDRLLAEVLNQVEEEGLKKYPINGGVDENAPAKDRLFGFVHSFLSRVLLACDEEEWELGKLISEAYLKGNVEFEQYGEPRKQEMLAIIAPIVEELLPKPVSEAALLLLVRSILSQTLMYVSHIEKIMEKRGGAAFTAEEISSIAKHITAFSIGGVSQYLENIDADITYTNTCCAGFTAS